MMNYKNIIKKQTSIIAISVIGLCIILISTSYALFFKVSTSTNTQVVQTGTLTTTYTNGSTMTTDMIPQLDSEGLATTGYAFTVKNTGSVAMNYEITIYNDPDATLTNASDTSSETDQNNIKYLIASSQTLVANATTTRNIRIWIDTDAPEDIIDKTVAIEIAVNGDIS